jgi:hypothetical protein
MLLGSNSRRFGGAAMIASHILSVLRPMVVPLLLLGGCASNPPPSPPPSVQLSAPDPALIAAVKGERETASKAYVLCLTRAAKRLDDRKSDPATVARGTLAACGTEFNQDVKAHSRHLDLDGEQQVARRLREVSLDTAIQLVLTNRKAAQSR